MADNNYVLLNKDVPVLNFTFAENPNIHTPLIRNINEVYNLHYAPLPLAARRGDKTGLFDLNYWWVQRGMACFLRSRSISALENTVNYERYYGIMRQSGGRSLNDHYWIKQEKDSRTYAEVNFFDNPFPEDFGDLFLLKEDRCLSPEQMFTPDLTLAGHSFKTWKNGGKGGHFLCRIPVREREIYNDLAAAEIFKIFGIDHVEYLPGTVGKMPVSVSKNFVSKDTEYCSFRSLANGIRYFDTGYLPKLLGSEKHEKILQDAYKIALIAYAVNNGDVELGILRRTDTLEITGLAPVFDFADAFWYGSVKEVQLHTTILQEIGDNLPYYVHAAGLDMTLWDGVIPAVQKVFDLCDDFRPGEADHIYQQMALRIAALRQAAAKPVGTVRKNWPLEEMWTLWMNHKSFEGNVE